MLNKEVQSYERAQGAVLAGRLAEPRRFIQVLAGPRQVGKSTLAQQVADRLELPVRYAGADEPMLRGGEWIAWLAIRSAGPGMSWTA